MTTKPRNTLAERALDPTPSALALYVHIPFCDTKCPYCDFNTYAGIEALMPTYVSALAHEIAGWGTVLEKPALGSVFFGGGTPSYLPTRDLTRLMRAIRRAFDLRDDAEITLEANPGDAARERLAAMRRAGFNRISIGVQSLDDDELRLLGRRHNAAQAADAVGAAREAGFDNISLDLIYGLPDQMVASWEHTLTEAIALGPDHISAYGLTLEPGTPLEADVRAGRVPEPDNDIAGAMYDVALEMLPKAGYQQYEISNWAKPGRESIHNLAYWRSTPYLGVGPGAHSYLWPSGPTTLSGMPPAGVRFATFRSPRDYIERAKGWTPAQSSDVMAVLADAPTIEDREELTQAAAVADVLMMGLRLNAGMADTEFKRRFGEGIAERVPGAVEECLGLGLVEWESGRLRLTDRGRPVANEAFERFVSAAREPA